jgi:ribonuclease R
MGEEWFDYDEGRMTLSGESSGRVWRLGQRVDVTVVGCTPSRGHIDFALAGAGRS